VEGGLGDAYSCAVALLARHLSEHRVRCGELGADADDCVSSRASASSASPALTACASNQQSHLAPAAGTMPGDRRTRLRARRCGNAFPSGHAVQSLSTFVALAVIAATLTSHRLLWTAAAILLATGVGLSRIYLGVHWATDVIAGWGAAALWVTGLVWLFDRVWPLPSRDERGPPRGAVRLRLVYRSTIIQAAWPVACGEPGDVGHD
jgi:membrane-associated phospholipid phosphatase